MSPSLIDTPQLTPYKFQDANEYIIITLYANGAYEVKDIEVLPETDSLEIRTSGDETWKFTLFDHVFPDQTEIQAQINEAKTQTTIELRLLKQQTRTTWPQLCSLKSTQIKPQRHEQNVDMIDQQIHSSIQPEEPFELSIKKLKIEFSETEDSAVAFIYIKKVYDCQVQFTETNFTAIFHTNDEDFLQPYSISSRIPLKLFVRVKERIVPDQCKQTITSYHIQIILMKDNKYGSKWTRLEPSEYPESRPLIQLPSPSTLPLSSISGSTINTNSIINNSNKAIPLPAPQRSLLSINLESDRVSYPSVFSSSTHQKDMTYKINSSTTIGYTGIYNPANSCFMNAALQCLSNTRELRDYFLQSYYALELNRTNPLGMKGAMAEEFAVVIRNLWNEKFSYTYADRLREFAAKRHQEFVGNGQHDAQELLTIVLDAIHEDLNRVLVKPQVPAIEDQNRSDSLIADEYWRGYLRRNDSIIVQLFTGQFKSKTKCPQCHKESVTFDPFTSLSVPLPKRISVDTIVIFRSDEKSPIKYRIVMSADGSIEELKRLLSSKCGLSIDKMVAHKIRGYRELEYLKDGDQVSANSYSWNSFDMIYITETLTSAECNNEKIVQLTFTQRVFRIPDYISLCGYCQAAPNPHGSPTYCTNCYQISYCDDQCLKFHAIDHKNTCKIYSKDSYDIVGYPFIISLPESKLTCENVFEQISIHSKRTADIQIDRSKTNQQSLGLNNSYNPYHADLDDYGRINGDDEEEDDFSDIENVDWATIKTKLSSSDSWSICRIGDYFVKTGKSKRRHNKKNDGKEKILKNTPTNNNNNNNNNNNGDDESMIINGDSESTSSTEDFDMLDDIYGSQPLFRIMPQVTDNSRENIQPIIEPGVDGGSILRRHTTFSIDWFTDNKLEAPLRVLSSKNRSGFNGLTEDDSVFKSVSGDQDVTLQQCLQLFIEPEVLGPDDKWYCPNCKEHIQAEKRMSVWRLPPILIIHLKRFKYNHCSSLGYMSNSREKIDTTIKFPTHNLNMAPFCSSISEENQEHNNSSQSHYDLYGIINHRGTAWFGHYTSYARLLAYNDPAKTEIGWRHFDDERVSTQTNIKDLVRSDAYVLFYRHRNLSVNLTLPDQIQSVLTESTNM